MGVIDKAGDWTFKAFTAGLGLTTIYLAATFSVNVYRGLSWHNAQSKIDKDGSADKNLIGRTEVLAYRDVEGKNAFDMAESTSQLEIGSSLRCAKASSSCAMQFARSLCSERALETDPAEFLNSPEQTLEILLKAKILMRRKVTIELRNIGLVVAALIAAATFQAVLSPPGGVGGPGGNSSLFTDGTNITAAAVSSTNITSNINATLFTPTDDPVKRLLFKGEKGAEYVTYGYVFVLFYYVNTSAFVLTMLIIMFVLPVRPFFPFCLLHGALYFLMISYATSFSLISPSLRHSLIFVIGSIIFAVPIYVSRFLSFLFEASDLEFESSVREFLEFPLSSVQKKRLQMLRHMMMNNVGE
ncbi:hypothetical protein Vadar_028544 [Vaccinium darrowii]|uniref:Uncharacterized protein n=1 Tax=Vaccinium darrowii TaxID=229202 RepID=A0ACB7ZNK9_9ERIC|nr:hypothetical protein Vadar_028544 [Vaccinium darrowii]